LIAVVADIGDVVGHVNFQFRHFEPFLQNLFDFVIGGGRLHGFTATNSTKPGRLAAACHSAALRSSVE
jgi:hypothetical protein